MRQDITPGSVNNNVSGTTFVCSSTGLRRFLNIKQDSKATTNYTTVQQFFCFLPGYLPAPSSEIKVTWSHFTTLLDSKSDIPFSNVATLLSFSSSSTIAACRFEQANLIA